MDAVGTDTAREYSRATMMVGAEAEEMTPLEKYDKDKSGRIDKDELVSAIYDYNIERTISKSDLVGLIYSYEIG